MTNETIEVTIDENGNVTFHAKGIKGSGCHDLLNEFAKDLGTIKDRKKTGEYYEKAKTGTSTKRSY